MQITKVINTKIIILIAEPSGRIDGEKMMSYVIDWISDRAHWDRQSLVECGWLETMDIDEIGKVRVKFDTGNGSVTVLYTQMKL